MIKRPYLNDYCEKCKHHYLLDGDESRCRKIRLGGLGGMIQHAMCAQVVKCDEYIAKEGGVNDIKN